MLSYFRTDINVVGKNDLHSVAAVGRKNHAAAFHSAKGGGLEICNHDDVSSRKIVGRVILRDSRGDDTFFSAAVVKGEL